MKQLMKFSVIPFFCLLILTGTMSIAIFSEGKVELRYMGGIVFGILTLLSSLYFFISLSYSNQAEYYEDLYNTLEKENKQYRGLEQQYRDAKETLVRAALKLDEERRFLTEKL